MQNTISLGPLNLPALPVLLIISVVAGHLLLRLIYRKRSEDYSRGSDLFFSGLLLFLGGWKLSLLLTNWQTVLKAPLALVYLTGGIINFIAGFLAACAGIALLVRSGKFRLPDIKTVLLICALSAVVLFPLVLLMPSSFTDSPSETGTVTLSTLEGRPETLELTGASVTIVNFWATWCPPCRAEIPELIEFYKEYKERGVRLIGVNMTTTESSVRGVSTFIDDQNINFPVYLDSWGEASTRFEINSIPVTMVFDKDGNLIRQKTGAVDSAWLKSSVRNFTD